MINNRQLDQARPPLPFSLPPGFSWVHPTAFGQGSGSGFPQVQDGGDLLLHILGGGGRAGSPGQPYWPGCVIVAPGGLLPPMEEQEPTKWDYLCLSGEPELLLRLAGEGPVCPPVPGGRAAGLFGQLVRGLESGSLQSVCDASAMSYALLMELCRQLGALRQASHPPLVAQALELIEARYAFLGGVEELAELLGVTKNHLIRVFKEAVGLSPGRCLQAARLENARLLLENRDYSIDMVAKMVGYSGANYFCKVFLRETGESPGQYRARHAAPAVPTPQQRRRMEELEALYQL